MTEEQILPPGWVWTTLGTITTINPKPDTSAMPEDTPVSFVPMAAVEAGTGYIDTSIQRPLQKVRRGYTAFQENDVLFAKITPCMENGKAAVAHSLVSGIGFGSTEFHVLRPLEDIQSKFIYYYISQQAFRRLARQHMTGTAGQLRVPASYLAEVSFPLAPLEEQQRIVEAIEERFSHIDAGVALLKAARRKLKLYRASVLKAAVDGALTEQWRAAHPNVEPAPQLLRRILAERRARWEEEQRAKGRDPQKLRYVEPSAPDTNRLPSLPDGWCWASLEQISTLQRGRFSIRPRNDPRYFGGIYPFIQIGDLPENGGNIVSFKQTLNDEGYKVSREFPIGTIVVSIAASIGNTGILTFRSCFPDSLVGITCHYSSMIAYVGIFLRTQKQELRVLSYASGGQPNINLPILQRLAIPLAPLAEQEQIVALVEEQLSIIGNVEATIEHGLRRAERQRQSVLRQAFTGQLVPQDENDEPASVLLERIRSAMNRAATQGESGAVNRARTSGGKRERGQKQREQARPARPPASIAPPGVDASNTVQPELWEGIEA